MNWKWQTMIMIFSCILGGSQKPAANAGDQVAGVAVTGQMKAQEMAPSKINLVLTGQDRDSVSTLENPIF